MFVTGECRLDLAALGDRDFLLGKDGKTTTIGTQVAYAFSASNNLFMAGFSSQGPTDVDFRVKPDVVAPGVNNAGMAEQSVRSGKYDRFVESSAVPRFGRPEDVARAILFFLEPDNYMTGQVLTVDGGLTLRM